LLKKISAEDKRQRFSSPDENEADNDMEKVEE
jgi:hypothetical protein